MEDAIKKLRRFEPDMSGYRDDQRKLHSATMELIKAGENEIGIYLHIRGGKSMLIRMLSVHIAALKLGAVGLVVNNRSELRRQIVEPNKWQEDFDRLNTIGEQPKPHGFAHVRRKLNGDESTGYWPDDPWPNSEYLLSTTIQTVCSRIDRIIPWIQSVNHSHGMPIIIFLDECQNYGLDEFGKEENESREWVANLRRIQMETNIILITLSGYPKREDGLCLPGFVPIDPEEKEREKWVKGKVIEKLDERRSLIEKNLIRYTKQSFNMMPRGGEDFIVGMKRGFTTNTLCTLHHHIVSHKITYKENGRIILNNQSLADVDETTARRILGGYLWDHRVIEACVQKFVDLLTEKRRANNSIKGLIYTMSDIAGRNDIDAHPKAVMAVLKRIAPNFKIRIVTANSEGSPADALLAFANDSYDALIFKNVGRVGFDCPPAKVLLDMSTVRTESMVAQTWLRVSTPYGEIPGEIITPSDITARNLYKQIVTYNGGDRQVQNLSAEIVDNDETIIEKTDRSVIVGEQEDMSITIHDLRSVTPEECKLVEVYLREHPNYNSLLHRLSLPERVEFVKMQMTNHGWAPPKDYAQPQPGPQSKGIQPRFTEAHQFRSDINKNWPKAVNRAVGVFARRELNSEQEKEWNKIHKAFGEEAKLRANQPADRELNQINNLVALEIILRFFEEKLA